jgi:hypothetical protein
MLPMGTRVTNPPEYTVQLVESDAPQDPQEAPQLANLTKAFAIQLTRIAPCDKVIFTVSTQDPDNLRAGKQVVFLRRLQEKVLGRFWEEIRKAHPKDAARLDSQLVLSAQNKQGNFFLPGFVSFELGRRPVTFLTDSEARALAIQQDLYARYKPEFIGAFSDRHEYKAPVVRIKTAGGESTYALFPAYVSTGTTGTVPVDPLIRKGTGTIRQLVPQSYEAESALENDNMVQWPDHVVPFVKSSIRLDGTLGSKWSGALVGRLNTPAKEGKTPLRIADLYLMNDPHRLYVAIDFLADTVSMQPPRNKSWGDYVKFIFDTNSDRVASDGDLQFAMSQGSRMLFCRRLKNLQPSGPLLPTRSSGRLGFAPSRATTVPHRIWEFAFDLNDIKSKPGQSFGMGVSIHAQHPALTVSVPAILGQNLPQFILGQPEKAPRDPQSRLPHKDTARVQQQSQ